MNDEPRTARVSLLNGPTALLRMSRRISTRATLADIKEHKGVACVALGAMALTTYAIVAELPPSNEFGRVDVCALCAGPGC